MSRDELGFLRRWSRLKRQRAEGSAASPELPSPDLPPLESLNLESDFAAFMHAKVDTEIRRAALKTLFRDPRFNIMDGLDVYIDDYSKEDPIPPGMLAQLQHARTTLFGPPAEEKSEEQAKPQEDAGTQPRLASSNEPPPAPCDVDLDSKPVS